LAFGDQEREGNQGVVGQAFGAIGAVENAVGAEELEEEEGASR
jgi:hypothetical protein